VSALINVATAQHLFKVKKNRGANPHGLSGNGAASLRYLLRVVIHREANQDVGVEHKRMDQLTCVVSA